MPLFSICKDFKVEILVCIFRYELTSFTLSFYDEKKIQKKNNNTYKFV